MKIKFYTDEHIDKAIIKGLRRRGVDVLTTPEAGLLGARDEEHLARALAEGRVLVTQDTDYLSLDAAGIKHAGIAYAPQRKPIGDMIRGLMLVYQVLDVIDMQDHVEYL